ncbi:MAG: PQQ-binding-like beta-propeller repeat protein [Actinomycetes bacterium]
MVAALLAALLSIPAGAQTPIGAGNAGTNRGDDGRTAWYPSASAPTPHAVSTSYVKRFNTPLSGQVYGQPVISRGTLIVVTESDDVVGLDPMTGALRWTTTLGSPVPSTQIGCGDIDPTYGITSTPVVDPATGIVYLTAHTMAHRGPPGASVIKMYAIDPKNGSIVPGFPVTIAGSAQNDPTWTFSAQQEGQRPGLALVNGVVYAAFASHCDITPWNGWIAGVSTVGRLTTLWVDEANETGQGGIWQAGAGLAQDPTGDLLVGAGNGPVAPLQTPGKAPGQRSLGNGALRLHIKPDGTIKATDFFQPYDSTWLSYRDLDFASGGVVILPDAMGSTTTPHLATTVNKSGDVFLLDRDNLGGMAAGANGGDAVIARLNIDARVWSTPSVWPGDGGVLYVTGGGTRGGSAPLVALKVTKSGGSSGLREIGASDPDFTFGSGSPSISSVSTASGTGVVWVTRCSDRACVDTSLDAYAAKPVDGQLLEIGSWPLGTGTKFVQPLIWHGLVFVGNGSSIVCVGPRPSTSAMATYLTGTAVVDTASTIGSIHIESVLPITVRGVTFKNAAFSLAPAAPSARRAAPATSLDIPVSVLSRARGEFTTVATVATSAGPIKTTVTAHVRASGPLLKESQGTRTVSLGGVAPKDTLTRSYPLMNIGSAPLEITGISSPEAPFAVDDSILGSIIAPGETIFVTMSVVGDSLGISTGSLTVTSSGGTATFAMSAISLP